MAAMLVLLGLLWATPATSQTIDHTDVVRQAKAAAIAAGVAVDHDDCSRFEVTMRVVQLLASEQAGLLDKPTGANCRGYATDIVAYRNGVIVDILGAGPEGPNSPHWMTLSPVDPARWRPPINLNPAPPTPTPPPADPPSPPPDPADSLATIDAKVDRLLYAVEQLRQQQAADTEKLSSEVSHVETRLNEVVAGAKRSAAPLILKILSLGTVK
jgi:hypothetical protein